MSVPDNFGNFDTLAKNTPSTDIPYPTYPCRLSFPPTRLLAPWNKCRTFSLTPLLALWVTYTVKTEWLLFEFLLRLCMAVVRISSPPYRRFKASCSDFTYTAVEVLSLR